LGAARGRDHEGAARKLRVKSMSRIRATINSIHAWRHHDEIAREVETELRFHIEMRTRANIEAGMTPDEAQRAALQSFGDFDNVKAWCCEIRRTLPFNPTPLRMGLHIAIAALAGAAALWTVNTPHHSLPSLLSQLGFVAVLTCLFVVARRKQKPHRQ
jgi:hypothetical protein